MLCGFYATDSDFISGVFYIERQISGYFSGEPIRARKRGKLVSFGRIAPIRGVGGRILQNTGNLSKGCPKMGWKRFEIYVKKGRSIGRKKILSHKQGRKSWNRREERFLYKSDILLGVYRKWGGG